MDFRRRVREDQMKLCSAKFFRIFRIENNNEILEFGTWNVLRYAFYVY